MFVLRETLLECSFRQSDVVLSTELSKYIWQLRDSKKDFNIKWTIICRARPYSNITKRCDLRTTEKLMIINVLTVISIVDLRKEQQHT